MMPDERPLAIITGAAKRVGRATALNLAHAGFDLIITWRNSQQDAEQTIHACAASCADERFRGRTVRCDLAQADDVARLGEMITRLDHLDALIHNASSYAPTTLDDLSHDELLMHYRINAASPAILTRDARTLLSQSMLPGGGAVVCFSDIHVLGRPRRNYLAYAMSKAALTQMVESLAIDLAPGIRVNAIAPGVVAWPDDTSQEEVAAYESRIPLDRPGTPEDAASLVRWLVLDATYVTGEVIRLDGGRWLR